MARAFHDEIGAKTSYYVAHRLDARLRRMQFFDIDGRLGAEFARERQPRRLRCADADDAAGAHFLRSRHSENADRAGALDHDRVAPFESACARGAVEGADA